MPTYQVRNPEMVALLSADLQARYEPQFAWVNAISAGLMLPALRGFWPMSSANESGAALDLSGQGRTLTRNGSLQYSLLDLAPRAVFVSGTTDYLSRADEAGLDILGNETYIGANERGLTFGGWFRPQALPGADIALMSKFTAAGNQRAYLLYVNAANRPAAVISGTGADTFTATHTATATLNKYDFYWARFRPSTAVDIGLNASYVSTVAGIPATVFNSNASFLIGASSAAAVLFTGSGSLCFLCAAALPDCFLSAFYEQTRALFGV